VITEWSRPVLFPKLSTFQDKTSQLMNVLLCKGPLSFKQYIHLKAAKFGKTFELCESRTGYLWLFLVYTAMKMELLSPLTHPQKIEQQPSC
jgi:hypothetical protein